MAIEVKSGVGAAPIVAGGFAAGQGMTRTRAQEGYVNALEKRRRLAEQQEFAFEQAAVGREHDMAMLHERQEIDREDFEFKLTAQQEQQAREFDVAEGRIRTDPALTEEERAEALHQLEAKRAGIQPVRQRKQPTVADQLKKNTVTQPDGSIIQRMPDGSFKELRKAPDVQKAVANAISGSLDVTGKSNPDRFAELMKAQGFTPEGQWIAPAEPPSPEAAPTAPQAPPVTPIEPPETIDQDAPKPPKPPKPGAKLTPEVAAKYKAKYKTREASEKAARADGWSF